MSVYLDRPSAYYSINLVRNRETIIPTVENPLFSLSAFFWPAATLRPMKKTGAGGRELFTVGKIVERVRVSEREGGT